MVAVWRRPLGRSLLWLVPPKFLSRSGAPHPPRIPAPARDTAGTGVRARLPPALPEPPARSRKRYLPGAPGPRSPRPPGAESGRAGGSSSSCSPGRAARSAYRRAESRGRGPPSPRGRGAGGRGPENGQEGARSGPLSPPARPPARNPAPSVPRPSASAAPSAGPGSVTRAASAINNPQPAPGDPPVTPDPRGGAAGETMTRCTRQPSC